MAPSIARQNTCWHMCVGGACVSGAFTWHTRLSVPGIRCRDGQGGTGAPLKPRKGALPEGASPVLPTVSGGEDTQHTLIGSFIHSCTGTSPKLCLGDGHCVYGLELGSKMMLILNAMQTNGMGTVGAGQVHNTRWLYRDTWTQELLGGSAGLRFWGQNPLLSLTSMPHQPVAHTSTLCPSLFRSLAGFSRCQSYLSHDLGPAGTSL